MLVLVKAAQQLMNVVAIIVIQQEIVQFAMNIIGLFRVSANLVQQLVIVAMIVQMKEYVQPAKVDFG